MESSHKLASSPPHLAPLWGNIVVSGSASVPQAHLGVMDTDTHHSTASANDDGTPRQRFLLEPALTLAELAAQLGLRPQALYDLRIKGRGPHGYRLGGRLHFRVSEVEAWLADVEAADQRCPAHDASHTEGSVSGAVGARP